MRQMTAAVCVIVACVFGAWPGVAAAASGSVALTIATDKSDYGPTEPITVSLTLKNTGAAPVYVNKRFYMSAEEMPKNQRDVYFVVTSPSGEKLPCKFAYPTGYPKTDYFESLGPGKEASAEYKRNLRGFFDFKEPGAYTITAYYENVFGAEIGLDVFTDKIQSNTVTVTITQEQKK